MQQCNYLRSVVSAGLFATVVLSAGPGALAQSANCECLIPKATLSSTGPLGQLVDVSGAVVLTSSDGPQSAASGASLRMGDRVFVGPQSSASISIGNCSLSLIALTELSLRSVDGNLCVAVEDTSIMRAGNPIRNAPLAIFTTLSTGAFLGEVLFDRRDDIPVSP